MPRERPLSVRPWREGRPSTHQGALSRASRRALRVAGVRRVACLASAFADSRRARRPSARRARRACGRLPYVALALRLGRSGASARASETSRSKGRSAPCLLGASERRGGAVLGKAQPCRSKIMTRGWAKRMPDLSREADRSSSLWGSTRK